MYSVLGTFSECRGGLSLKWSFTGLGGLSTGQSWGARIEVCVEDEVCAEGCFILQQLLKGEERCAERG